MSGQLDIIGLTADEVEAEARRSVASGAGLDARAPLLDVVRQHGGHAELLADGTMVASFPENPPGAMMSSARTRARLP